jgi:MFS family permease
MNGQDAPIKSAAYKRYLLGVLLVILAFNQKDRLALGLVLQEIKIDLSLSDTQLGLLTGIAFALFYSAMGIPIARWADRGNRVAIISLTTALWSGAVALCAAAGSFMQLLLIRVGVAVGEAGCIPPAHSLIADQFPRAERARAIAVYMLGAPLSMVIGYFLAGWLNELYGWRTMFVVLGLPGVALALLARFTLHEPRRATPSDGAAVTQPSLRSVCTTLWANRTFRYVLISFSLSSFFGNGIGQWQASFFVRSYHMTTGELGTWFALIYGTGGLLGTYCGGAWASRFAVDNERLQLKVLAFMYSSFSLLWAMVYLVPNRNVAFALMWILAVGGGAAAGPLYATIQTLVPQRMRAMSIALILFFSNLIGTGLGPLAAGVISDGMRAAFEADSLRYALLTLCPGYCVAAWYLWRASRTVSQDLEALRTDFNAECHCGSSSQIQSCGRQE